MKVLHINASTRRSDSQSLSVANHLINEIKSRNKGEVDIDLFNLFEDSLPAFDRSAVGAKMALFTGAVASAEERKTWEVIEAVFKRFAAADTYVFNVPLWNNGIPYILKQFIDIVTQPGWAFGFDPSTGYTGLLKGKKAYVVHASGVYYADIPVGFGSDFATPYLEDWLNFIGVEDVEHIHVAPTVVNVDFAKTKAAAEAKAVELIRMSASN
jgi:FMN-dependent NADH-azoreductase